MGAGYGVLQLLRVDVAILLPDIRGGGGGLGIRRRVQGLGVT